MVMSSMPRPTTVKPITEPEENATRRPLFRLSEAACAVRALELVAIFMPMKPGEHGPDAAGEERERGKLGEHFAAGGKSDHQQDHEHDWQRP